MKLPKFKIRASAIGKIMSEPRSKKDKEAGVLSETTKSYVDTWIKEQLYDRKKEFGNRFTNKGIDVEDKSIEYLNKTFGWKVKNNKKQFENEWITGEPDIIKTDDKTIKDVKSSWDCFSFPLHKTELDNKDYYWQGQGYMDLLRNKKTKDYTKYEVIYVLMNTPEYLIEKEFYYTTGNSVEFDTAGYQEFRKNYLYEHLPAELRIKRFHFERNDDDIKKIHDRVEQIRNYIKELGYETE